MAEDRMLSDEILLALIKKNSGGGGGGTNNYNQLENKPQIGGVTLQGNKTASDLGLASEEDLEEKQDVLTAGNYVSISNDGTINVTKAIGVYDNVRYVFTPEGGGYYMGVEVYINDVKRFEQQYQNTAVFNHVVIMELVEFWYGGDGYYWHYKPLIDSREHAKDEVIRWYYTEMDVHEETFDVPQDDSTTLATKGDVNTAINAIKDGTNIDSFADVESALANKQDKTDNNLETTAKTIVGAINEHEGDIDSLKSGLTNLTNVLTISQNSDISKLKEGINAVLITTGFVIGEAPVTPVTLSNNFRGCITRNGSNLVGMISNYDSTVIYHISSTTIGAISYYKDLS